MAVVFAAVLALAACSADHDRVVPREYRKAIKQAAKECPELTPRLLAAQIDQESGFDPDAVALPAPLLATSRNRSWACRSTVATRSARF